MDLKTSHLQPEQKQILEKVLAMGKGDGEEDSYTKNSGLQKSLNRIPLSALSDALERVIVPVQGRNGTVVVADLGSSSGPNTIDNVTLIIDKLRSRLSREDAAEFQAYFNDLPSNDFNNLFRLFSEDGRAKNFFAAGVPGSYFHRLFAQSSVHVFFSSLCLHWLSKIPEAVLDENGPAFNKGSTWIMHSRSAVGESYRQQASVDLKRFLDARAAELVRGGLLFFYCLGRPTSKPNEPTNCSINEFQVGLDEVWSEMVAEGLLTNHQQDTFNIPFYHRTIEDVTEAIASQGSLFEVVTIKLEEADLRWIDILGTADVPALATKIVGMFKALWSYLLEVHVGKKAMEVIWYRYERLVEKRIRTSPHAPKFRGHLCVVGLIRK